MDFARLARTVTAIAVAVSATAGSALAQNSVCTDLEAQLASLERGPAPGSITNSRQYDASIARQRIEIDQANAEARRAGCTGGFLIFQPRPEAKCGALMATIDRMQANLQRLSASRSRYASDPYEVSRRRSEVLRALSNNRCGNYAMSGAPQREGNFLEMLFGQGRINTFNDGYYSPNGQFGTYRTLCVRTCDGYYFPISFSTVPGHFAADEQTCQSMCPGSEVSLYTYRNPGEDTNQMVSLAGEPYTALPSAFRYRKEYDAACTCGATTAALANYSAPTTVMPRTVEPIFATIATPKPIARPAAGEDPETLANRGGRFVPRPATANTRGPEVAGVGSTAGRNVRVVGPSYYYGQ